MSLSRWYRVFRLDFLHNFRRPLFWFLIVIVALTCWGLSTGVLQIATGDSRVGGTKAYITSQFAVSQMLVIVVFLFYGFFIAVASGMPIIRDDELKISDLLRSSSLTVGEYVWGKFAAVLIAFLGVLGLHLLLMIFFNHFVPNSQSLEIRGPFAYANYLVPAVVFAVPTIVFLSGVSFAVGEWTRRPILLFLLPVALLLICGFFLWDWSPNWLDPRLNRVLMLIDPSAFRWLNETWLKGDRGVRFYNAAPVEFDRGITISRLCFLALGMGAVALSQLHLAMTVRGTAGPRRSWFDVLRRRRLPGPQEVIVAPSPAPSAALAMRSGVPSYWRSIGLIARTELRELRSQPGLYLFVPLILLQTITTATFVEGAFGTPLLQTPGTLAVGSMNILTTLVCLLLMFYTVESLRREQGTGLASIHYATPIRTSALLFGKAMANSLVGVAIVLANLVACLIVIAIQGKVHIELWPFALVWGLLLVPTFLVWTSFITAAFSLTNNREATYGFGLGALIGTGYLQLGTKHMSWVANWPLWSAVHWSDMGVLEFDRSALILNRVMVLGLSVFFTVLAVGWFRRRDVDPGRVWTRLYPVALLKRALALSPYAVVPLVAGIILFNQVGHGFEGRAAKKDRKDYWRKNLATWKDVPIPALAAVDIDLSLDPQHHSFHSQGTYEIENQRTTVLRQIPLTAGDHWNDVSWTMNGKDYTPDNRSLLYVFTPPKELAPGEKVKIGFSFDGRFPQGISKNGRGVQEFILPSGVVLTSFTPSFAPVVGYIEQVGVEEDNKYEAKEYPDDFYKGQTDPAFGAARGFPTHLRITAPEEYTINSVGVLEKNEVAGGKRTVEWRSDHPVRFFNVVAGKWAVHPGQGTAVYYHPGHDYNLDEISEALDAARKYYSEWFWPYPWKELKLSEFPNLSTYAQGFPTDITFSEGIGFLTRSDAVSELAFMVAAHESAHQWWGNILTPGKGPGGDILSEGMAHFSTALLFEQVKGPRGRIEFLKNIEHRYEISRRMDSERPLVKIDGSQNGDTTVTYDKGGWVFWMLLRHMGRKQALAGLQEFIKEYHEGPDFPVLQDFIEVMRRYAPDTAAYDKFVKQWFFEVVVSEYQLTGAERKQSGDKDAWDVVVNVKNVGTGKMTVEVAAATGERFDEKTGKPKPDYKDARTVVELGAGEAKDVKIHCPFKPDRVFMDPDAFVLQLRRKLAVARF
ncbi:MAG TPA: M1 family aminopeptidase [Planctomycetaceae bacterium]|jgi:ABC-type transport system involved in multi-copper enzyme maturation permease subunit|nr:M1 family aminopeptidase [Planctomycetaceae bacterium]